MSAYIQLLNSQLASIVPVKPAIERRFLDWYNSLPEVTRHRPFAMQEFELALNTQGKYISKILLDLGWQRKRRWSTTGSYHRYWVPPTHP
jgi:hypothetical protein